MEKFKFKPMHLNGIWSDFKKLTGINFKYIPVSGKQHFSCPYKRFCLKQNANCRQSNFEEKTNHLSSKSDFSLRKLGCGLCEFVLPLYDHGALLGAILTDKFKKKDLPLKFRVGSSVPILSQRQIAALISLFNRYRQDFRKTFPVRADVTNEKDDLIIKKAESFIKKNFRQPKISLKELAREVHVSYFYLCRLFKKELDLNFVRYVSLVRLKAALKLLTDLKLTIPQISEAAGFTDSQYFYRVFKRVLGCTPKDYRRNNLKRMQIRQKIGLLLAHTRGAKKCIKNAKSSIDNFYIFN